MPGRQGCGIESADPAYTPLQEMALLKSFMNQHTNAIVEKVEVEFNKCVQAYHQQCEAGLDPSQPMRIPPPYVAGAADLYVDLLHQIGSTRRVLSEEPGMKYCLVTLSLLHVYLIHCMDDIPCTLMTATEIRTQMQSLTNEALPHTMYSIAVFISFRLGDKFNYGSPHAIPPSQIQSNETYDELYGYMRKCILHSTIKSLREAGMIMPGKITGNTPQFLPSPETTGKARIQEYRKHAATLSTLVKTVDGIESFFGIAFAQIFYVMCPVTSGFNYERHPYGMRTSICLTVAWSPADKNPVSDVVEHPVTHEREDLLEWQLDAMLIAYIAALVSNKTSNECYIDIHINADVLAPKTDGALCVVGDTLLAVYNADRYHAFKTVPDALDYIINIKIQRSTNTRHTEILTEARCLLWAESTASDFKCLLQHYYAIHPLQDTAILNLPLQKRARTENAE